MPDASALGFDVPPQRKEVRSLESQGHDYGRRFALLYCGTQFARTPLQGNIDAYQTGLLQRYAQYKLFAPGGYLRKNALAAPQAQLDQIGRKPVAQRFDFDP